ncbi:DEAD/DEAH box helicase family protein [Marinovum sp. 2_MG-2023]|uniref:type III restriction-modification system endonuclease n=1 Tax=unclassified Marinovum TaxID=2647166 RepID=UPI0026E154FD|nr:MULTISPECIES: DEAD/DEAH box helicase family protein [unclassified Marinovum]MDO6732466.1 DEAD/DEAH box helicase family protein [Marinovum sp. 2_MG-2023]MDO6781783.1 DEAD/DEAH box helicase family protein [Marinovum sp. 1_MG-2023]
MKIKFKSQPYQLDAVNAVVDCFKGQPRQDNLKYTIDPGNTRQMRSTEDGFGNADIKLPDDVLLENVVAVQRGAMLPQSQSLTHYIDANGRAKPATYKPGAKLNLDVEMETGTGKTYVYIRTMFELYKRYGWSKFIIMVPSVAIREGVAKSLQMTAEHFQQEFGKKIRAFTYNSKRLHELESFSSDAGINVMVINVQAFNATGADNRRIYDELDDFQSRRPIDVIAKNRPILIIDEPQKMEGPATQKALPKFSPLFILRYSATHKTMHNKVHRLDAVDAFNQKLVKKIEVRGIETKGLTGTNAYLYLEGIDISKSAPVARVELEVKTGSGIKRVLRKLERGRDLFNVSKGLEQYRGFVISDIDARDDTLHFTNGDVLSAGQASNDVTEDDKRRIQIRETIAAHLRREQALFARGIKVLSLFFIDEVVKYRDYKRADEKGEYARIFEEEYANARDEILDELPLENEDYRKYLADIDHAKTHRGYFSIDKKGRMTDPKAAARGELQGQSTEPSDYDLILKDKERLLSFDEPTRFIFSHSALREGWDNPNVFVMCMLKHNESQNTISRRQEVGRGLRISVNKVGERMDLPATVHDINVLTVVASESYKGFVSGLQQEIVENLSERPRAANAEYFEGKLLKSEDSELKVDKALAGKLEFYLIANGYVDEDRAITAKYHDARKAETLAQLPEAFAGHEEEAFKLVDTVFNGQKVADMFNDGRAPKKNPLNANFHKQEFQELWRRINRKAVYQVEFETEKLVQSCVTSLDKNLRNIPALQYLVTEGTLNDGVTDEDLRSGQAFAQGRVKSELGQSAHSRVSYDVVGSISEATNLTRRTIGTILSRIEPAIFGQFNRNPEQFIAEAAHRINEQKAGAIVEQLTYSAIEDEYDSTIFTAGETGNDFKKATDKLNHHVYDYAIVDSDVERRFVKDLDTSSEVVVYSKLPRGFLIPTPVGDYNPDWAIAFKKDEVKHLYFVAETKSEYPSMKMRELEKTKIECARKFFSEIGERIAQDKVKYDVATSYADLMNLVKEAT